MQISTPFLENIWQLKTVDKAGFLFFKLHLELHEYSEVEMFQAELGEQWSIFPFNICLNF